MGYQEVYALAFQDELTRKVFCIPKFVTLPEDMPNALLKYDDEEELTRDLQTLKEEIIKVRRRMARIIVVCKFRLFSSGWRSLR